MGDTLRLNRTWYLGVSRVEVEAFRLVVLKWVQGGTAVYVCEGEAEEHCNARA
jgi:hypothetical protein